MISWDEVCRLARGLGGLPVLRCRPGSPAANAGVRYGDVLLTVNGMATPDWASFIEARGLVKGEMVVEIFREGQTTQIRLALVAQTSLDARDVLLEMLSDGGVPTLGGSDPTVC